MHVALLYVVFSGQQKNGLENNKLVSTATEAFTKIDRQLGLMRLLLSFPGNSWGIQDVARRGPVVLDSNKLSTYKDERWKASTRRRSTPVGCYRKRKVIKAVCWWFQRQKTKMETSFIVRELASRAANYGGHDHENKLLVVGIIVITEYSQRTI